MLASGNWLLSPLPLLLPRLSCFFLFRRLARALPSLPSPLSLSLVLVASTTPKTPKTLGGARGRASSIPMADMLRFPVDPDLRSPPPPPPPPPPPHPRDDGHRTRVDLPLFHPPPPPSPTPGLKRDRSPEGELLPLPPPLGSSRPDRLSDHLEGAAAPPRAEMRSASPTPTSERSPSPPLRLDDPVGCRSPPRGERWGARARRFGSPFACLGGFGFFCAHAFKLLCVLCVRARARIWDLVWCRFATIGLEKERAREMDRDTSCYAQCEMHLMNTSILSTSISKQNRALRHVFAYYLSNQSFGC